MNKILVAADLHGFPPMPHVQIGATTAPNVAPNPANRRAWNEKDTVCI